MHILTHSFNREKTTLKHMDGTKQSGKQVFQKYYFLLKTSCNLGTQQFPWQQNHSLNTSLT